MHNLKTGIHLGFGMSHGTFFCTKGLVSGVTAEHIGAAGTEVVPPCHGEGQMLLHGLAHDDTVGIVILKSEGVGGGGAFVGDHGDILEDLRHNIFSFLQINLPLS